MDRRYQFNVRLIATLSSVLAMPPSELISLTGIATTTWYRLKQHPDAITIQQLLAIANGLHIPVRRFFYVQGEPCVVGYRNEYEYLPYTPCYYDADALQQYVDATDSATWLQASRELGVTRDNLRRSLLGASRTPVQRFLQMCHVFGIDPFTVLIDTNPEVMPDGSRPTNKQQAHSHATMRIEIGELRKKLGHLSDTVVRLTEDYKHLQDQHEALLREFRAYTEGSSIPMAADPIPDPEPDED